MLFRAVLTALYSNNTKHDNVMCVGKVQFSNVTSAGTHSHHWDLKGSEDFKFKNDI